MANTFNSVVLYGSWLEIARRNLPEDKVAELMVQLMEYGLYGKIPQNDNLAMNLIFEMAKPNIDSNIQKKISGAKGGRPRKPPKEKTYGLSNVNGNGNANVNGNVNDNANDNVPAADATPRPEGGACAPLPVSTDDNWRMA